MLLTIIIYGRSVGFDFVDFDDPFYVLSDNTTQWWSWSWVERLQTYYIGYPVPLPIALYALLRRTVGDIPAWFHGLNVFVHICNVLLLWRVLARGVRDERLALLCAALWAAHPMLVEAVCWVTALKDLLCAMGQLLALWAVWRVRDSGERRWMWGAVVGALIAFMSKPVAFILGPLLLVALYLERDQYSEKSLRFAGGFAVLLSVYGLFHAWFAQQAHNALVGERTGSLAAQLPQAVAAARLHVENMLVPLNLHAGYTYIAPDALGWIVAVAASVASIVGLYAAWRYKLSVAFIGLFWALAAYVPYSNLLPVGRYTGDSYLYLPLMGLTLALCAGLARLSVPGLQRPAWLWAFPLALLVSLSVMQVGVWQDTLSLWMRVISYEPEHGMAHAQLGQYLYNRGLYAESLKEFEHPSALARYGTTLPFPTEWPLAYIKLGRYDEAEIVLLKFFRVVDAQREVFGEGILKSGLLAPQIKSAYEVYVYMIKNGYAKHAEAAPVWLNVL